MLLNKIFYGIMMRNFTMEDGNRILMGKEKNLGMESNMFPKNISLRDILLMEKGMAMELSSCLVRKIREFFRFMLGNSNKGINMVMVSK